MDVAKELKRQRKLAGLTQQQLADKAKISRATVRLIEGGHVAKPGILTLLASALELSPNPFLGSNTESNLINQPLRVALPLPDGLMLTDEEVKLIRKRMLDSGRELLTLIRDLRTKQGEEK